MNREPPYLGGGFTGAGGRGGAGEIKNIVHAYLVTENDVRVQQPELAVESLSVERGTWRLNTDGSMDTTWRLRPGVRWHDGTPFTSADLLFTFNVNKDPDLSTPWTAQLALMESAEAPDPLTFIVYWPRPYVDADRASGLDPLPRHLLEDSYRADKASFPFNPIFTTEFVGLGPYRLVRWEHGVDMEFSRFDEYFGGRPPFDSVLVRFIFDSNALVANILAGGVDVIVPPSVGLDTALEVKSRWEGTGNRVLMISTGRLRHLEIQHRPDVARPRLGLTERAVRQAFYQAIDRQGFADAVTLGLAPVADSWIAPNHPLRAQIEAAIPQFPYDVSRAQQLLTQAGWLRAGDGAPSASSGQALVHAQTGERFDVQLRADQGAGKEREITIIGEYWKALGALPEIDIIPSAREGDRQYESLSPGTLLTGNLSPDEFYGDRTQSRFISTAANRWTGRNRMAYSNPNVDALLERMVQTIDPRDRLALHRQLLQEQGADLPMMPLYYEIVPVFLLRAVKPSSDGARTLWGFAGWDKE